MLHIHHRLSATSAENQSLASDLFLASTRRLVLSLAALFFLVWLILPLHRSDLLSFRYLFVLVALGVETSLTMQHLRARPRLALGLWLGAQHLRLAFALVVVPDSAFRFLFVPIPFVAVVLLGWRAGLAFQGLLLAVLAVLGATGYLPSVLAPDGWWLPLLSGVLGLVAWATIDTFFSAAIAASDYSRQASHALQQARDRQVELFQTQSDLIHANQELRRLSDRLQALQHVAEQARQAKAEFVANVSHELRAPLNMILGFSEMIAGSPRLYGAGLPPKLLADVAIIQKNAQHLSRLVDDVLDLSQLDTHRMALSKELGSLRTIVTNATLSVQPLYASKGLYLETDLPAHLPEVYCDVTRLQQILINLLSNAGRFTVQGGTRIRVEDTGQQILFHITDTGPGISAENQARLFQPFQQLDTSLRRQFGGSGLGLNISKQFIALHGGEIWVESTLGQGTTFSFSLPYFSQPTASERTIPSRRWTSEHAQRDARPRRQVPLPDTHPQYAVVEPGATLHRLLERYGDSTSVVAVGELPTALELLHHSPAQALLVNSFPLMQQIKSGLLPDELYQLPYAIPAITCWIPGREDTIRELGVVDYLFKPVSPAKLLNALRCHAPGAQTVLAVDDEPDALTLLSRILAASPEAPRVLQAQSGDRALELMRQHQPDLVILDLIMPSRDGYQVLLDKAADAALRDIPVIILSSLDPALETRAANTLLITRQEGFTVQEFMRFVQLVGEAFTPAPTTN